MTNLPLNTTKTEWDLSPLYKSDNDPQMLTDRKVVEKLNYDWINKWKSRTDWLEDPKALREALDELEKLNTSYGIGGKELYYFGLRTSLDQADIDLKAKETKIEDFAKKIYNDGIFFIIKLSKVDPKIQQQFLAASELEPYRHWLEQVFAEGKHTLSEPEEQILTLTYKTSMGNWIQMREEFISSDEQVVETKDGKKTVTFEELISLASDRDKKTRDNAAAAVNKTLTKFEDIAVHEINSVLEYKKVQDQLRHYERPDEGRHLSDDIDTEVVDTLVKAVSRRNDISRRFYALKAKLLGQPKLTYYERGVEYTTADKKYDYSGAVSLVYTVFQKLDPEFAEIFQDFVEHGRIDVYPKKGKRTGAFCTHDQKAFPVYVMLNFTGVLREVTTLAHEMGHGINFVLTQKHQNSFNIGAPTSTAEVASTFMEDFVLQELGQQVNDETRLSLNISKLNDEIASIFRQISLYKLETELHQAYREKGYLSKEFLHQLFTKHMQEYMGEAVEFPKESGMWWVYWSHIRYFFYVYSYAGGLLISKSLQALVKEDSKFIGKVKEFLSAGRSDSPKNILAKAGVDITDPKFWDKGLDEVEQLLQDTEALARRLGKIS